MAFVALDKFKTSNESLSAHIFSSAHKAPAMFSAFSAISCLLSKSSFLDDKGAFSCCTDAFAQGYRCVLAKGAPLTFIKDNFYHV